MDGSVSSRSLPVHVGYHASESFMTVPLLAISILLPGFMLGGQQAKPNPGDAPRTGKLAAPVVLPLAGGLMIRYLQQIGGRVAMWKLDSFSAHATIGMDGGDNSGELDMAFGKPDRISIKLDLGSLGSSVVGSDGQIAWEITTNDDQEEIEIIDRKDAQRRRRELNWFELAIRLNENARIFRTIAPAEFEGHPCWEIQKVTRSGKEDRIFLDRENYLLRGIRMIEQGPQGDYEITLAFRDWKPVEQLKLFHEVVISQSGLAMTIAFDRISLDTVPPKTFEPPETVKVLLADEAVDATDNEQEDQSDSQ
ncbi:MAG: hypothetical protein CMJ39_10260 [Phycisphaerae bacterium]|nr:hypothetical protein [Phycisphaerae bacterium]